MCVQCFDDKATQTEMTISNKATQTTTCTTQSVQSEENMTHSSDMEAKKTNSDGDDASAEETSEGEYYWEYEGDPNYDGPEYHSLPMPSLRGHSYKPQWTK